MVRIRDLALERRRAKERLAAMSPEERERECERRRERDRRRRAEWKAASNDITKLRRTGPPAPPDHVLEEAARAAAAPRSLTAEICGDPPPGRRALDAKAGPIGLQAVAEALGLDGA